MHKLHLLQDRKLFALRQFPPYNCLQPYRNGNASGQVLALSDTHKGDFMSAIDCSKSTSVYPARQPKILKSSQSDSPMRLLPTPMREPAITVYGYPPAPHRMEWLHSNKPNVGLELKPRYAVEFVRLPADVRCALESKGWTFVEVERE